MPAAEKLHFLVSAAITGYMKQLNGIVPGILNSLGKHFLQFRNFKFEIINSDIRNKEVHKIAINFFSEPMIWHDTIGDNLLVSEDGREKTDEGFQTYLLALQPFLSIYSLNEVV